MSSRSSLGPVEAEFRDLRGAIDSGDGRAAMAAIERRPYLGTLRYVGDGLRLALAQGVPSAAGRAEAHIGALRDRDLDGEADDDGDRWLRLDSLGSMPGFRDMVECFDTVADERLATRLDRALGGRGAFRRFKDELAAVPDELARFCQHTDDRRRGRARQWLAASGLRPAVPADPATPGRPDHHGLR